MQSDMLTSEQALSFLRSQVQDCLEALQEAIKDSVDQGAFDKAQSFLQEAQDLDGLLDELSAWAKRFKTLVELADKAHSDEEAERLRKGLKTPQSTYRVPILRALVTLGGEATINDVLERVEAMLSEQLNDYDRDVLSDGKTIRWVNTVQWARNAMREESLIRADTPRGVWGISDKGKAWLKAQSR